MFDVKGFITKNWKGIIGAAVGALGLIGAAGFISNGIKPVVTDGKVMLKSWERRIYIQKLETIRDSGWTVPKGGRVYDTRCEYKGTKKVPIGVDENGNTCYKEVSEHATKYYYEVDEWRDVRSVYAQNNSDKDGNIVAPYWPNVGELGDSERVGSRSELYEIHIKVRETGELKTFKVDQSTWDIVNARDDVRVTSSVFHSNKADTVEVLD